MLDWEFAFSGSPLIDMGHFLRFEDERWLLVEPEFSGGFLRSGGALPESWRTLSRIADLVSINDGGIAVREDLVGTGSGGKGVNQPVLAPALRVGNTDCGGFEGILNSWSEATTSVRGTYSQP